MNRWAIAAIPLIACLAVGEAVVRQWVADQAFRQAKEGIEKYERVGATHASPVLGKGPRPSSDLLRGEPLKKAVRLEPHSSQCRNYLGRYYQALAADMAISDEEREELARRAIREHEKAVELDPLNGVYRAYLAHMQRAIGRHYDARGLNPSLSDEERAGFSSQAVEYHGKAIANFEKAISLNRSNPFIRNLYEAYRGRL